MIREFCPCQWWISKKSLYSVWVFGGEFYPGLFWIFFLICLILQNTLDAGSKIQFIAH